MNAIFCIIILLINSCLHASICLNMIVKDEAPVILKALESAKPIIDYWVIVDTGSTDGTQDLICSFMQDIPGELHERPWVDFAHNRNEALELALGKTDYILFLDADDYLSYTENFSLQRLDQESYYIRIKNGSLVYFRHMLVNADLNWKWTGVLHEYISCSKNVQASYLDGITNICVSNGHRSTDPQKYAKDALILEKALIKEPENERYVFYLAQSYRDAGDYELALKNYQKRIELKGWQEEVFWSMFEVSRLKELLDYPADSIIDSYYNTYLYRPTRAEPLCRLANYYRRNKKYQAGYEIAFKGLSLEKPTDLLFVQNNVYEWDLLLEFSICAYWIENYNEALLSSLLILKNENLPKHVRECVEKNIFWIHSNLH